MSDRKYWLVKSEPEEFSFDDLLASPHKTTQWDGVRSYAARIHLRAMKAGDVVLFYHSNANPPAIVGVAEVVCEAYPDHTAFDVSDAHHDPTSDRKEPKWFTVDLRALKRLKQPVSLDEVKNEKGLANMALLRIGRLSVQPVTEREYEIVRRLGG